MLETSLTIYHNLKTIVSRLCQTLNINEREHSKGRKPLLTNSEALTAAILWRKQNVGSKKSFYEILEPPCSYNRFVAALNGCGKYLGAVIAALLRLFGRHAHPVKFTDATDIPVCLNKNAVSHKTLRGFASWGHSGKGFYFGLKLACVCAQAG